MSGGTAEADEVLIPKREKWADEKQVTGTSVFGEHINSLMATDNNSATLNNIKYGTLAVDGWAVTSTRRGLGPSSDEEGTGPLLAVPNVTVHPSTASVPITALLYKGPLVCGFNVPIKGLNICESYVQYGALVVTLWT